MGLVNKSDYIYAKLQDKALQINDELIELDDKEIIRLGLKSQDVLTVNIEHIEWANTEPLETYEGTKVSLPKINIYWDDETITEASINYTMVDNVSYYLEAGNYELRAIYRDFTSTNVLPITVIEKVLVSIEWENTNSITTQQNHKAYLPYIKLNYNDGKFKRLSSQSPGVTLSDSEYYLELGEKTLTATYKEFTTNELTINVIEEEIIDEDTHDYSQDYLTFEALEDGVFNFTGNDLQYSINNGQTWLDLGAGQNTILIYKNTKLIWKHKSNSNDRTNLGTFSSTGRFNVMGHILSIKGDTYYAYRESDINQNALKNAFSALFRNCTKLIHAKNLILPKTVGENCYAKMFDGCTSLITAPKLPATILAKGCYEQMFSECTNLITAPELPATILEQNCYKCMFSGCTSLITAPELPATTLIQYCYELMFARCTSLITAPELPSIILAQGCYAEMFAECTSLITAPELPATTMIASCYSFMFGGCIRLTTAPELPATILAQYCYNSMFERCTKLINAPELPATELAIGCYSNMFKGCISLTIAPELPATTLTDSCYQYMFYGCTNLTVAPELPATTLTDSCYQYMFYGCTNLTVAPELPALQLAPGCYFNMFNDCVSLNYIKCLAINPEYQLFNWYYYGDINNDGKNDWGYGLSGTFVKLYGSIFKDNDIPHSWTVQEIDPETGEIVNEYINE